MVKGLLVTKSQPSTAVESVRDNASGRDFDKDSPLREDIRMLGRLLGDTIRDQEGADVFDLVECIRINSVRFHRDADETARRELESTLDELPTMGAARIVRAFSYFAHLANIAEDRHHI